ncbi:MAG: hypothetical protein CUN55_18705, partial [Phototrophicales bacterium]
MKPTDTCKYDTHTSSVDSCSICKEGLCSGCGWRDEDGSLYCNECWTEFMGRCDGCGGELEAVYEDMRPDGVGYYEVVGYKPC